MADIIQDKKEEETVSINPEKDRPDNLKTDVHKKKSEEKIKGEIAKGMARY